MDVTDSLWFQIEDAFSQIEEQCLIARASQLVVDQHRAEELVSQAVAVGRSVPPPAPPPSKTIEVGRYARAGELAKDIAFREANEGGPDLVVLRENLRRTLSELRRSLVEGLAEHDVYYVLFPLVMYTDELVAKATRGAAARWEPMQSEFYEVDNGGELFYQVLEDRLKEEHTHPLVLETFYFCLLDGFTGMHLAGSKRIDEYRARLRERIPRPEILFKQVPVLPRRPELVQFPVHYYALAAATILLVYLALRWGAPA
jgi:type IV/VI secretion system ImpK/VasF family protein